MMKIYIKFLTITYFKSLLYVLAIMISLVFILNYLGELDFFQKIEVESEFTLFLSLLKSPSMIFDMSPFIVLITVQIFFVKLFNNNELITFKYSGLENFEIIKILIILSFITGILTSTIFYYFSSNFKNLYLELKSPFTNDGKYLAVVTQNGLWIRDKIQDKTLVINSSRIDKNYLMGNFITEFDKDYKVIKNIKSNKIDVGNKEWLIYEAKIYEGNNYSTFDNFSLKTNFDLKRINSLYSNLSSMNLFELLELRGNYKKLNYSIVDVDLQILKLISLPIFLILICLFSSMLMLRIKHLSNTTLQITLGLFFSVIIYYLNNFFYVLGSTEKLGVYLSIFTPLIILSFINLLMLNKVNEK